MCLYELEIMKEMANLTRNSLFPTAEEVAALSLQFSIPSIMHSSGPTSAKGEEAGPGIEQDHTPQRPMAPLLTHKQKRLSLSLDTTNRAYEELIKERQKISKDYIQLNIVRMDLF